MKFRHRFYFIALTLVISVCCACARSAGRIEKPKAIIPAGYDLPAASELYFADTDVSVRLSARRFAQGETVLVEITPAAGKRGKLTCTFESAEVALSRRPWGCRGLFGISPEEKPGKKLLTVRFTRGKRVEEYYFPITVEAVSFPVYKKAMDLGMFSNFTCEPRPEIIEFIHECSRKKREAFDRNSPDMIGTVFSHPLGVHGVTSRFWSHRVYGRYRFNNGVRKRLPPENNVHSGLDLKGKQGDPVYAMADGIVALAEPMFYEGNFVVIDHGNRVFSYYMHLQSFEVKQGRRVSAGEIIGHVGSTGISTGPHLHVSLMVGGVQVDPLSILPLKPRD